MDLLASFLPGFFGWLVGLFLWSSIIGSLFVTLPLQLRLERDNEVDSINWPKVIIPVIIAVIILLVIVLFSESAFIGSLVAGAMTLTRIKSLRAEALENYERSIK